MRKILFFAIVSAILLTFTACEKGADGFSSIKENAVSQRQISTINKAIASDGDFIRLISLENQTKEDLLNFIDNNRSEILKDKSKIEKFIIEQFKETNPNQLIYAIIEKFPELNSMKENERLSAWENAKSLVTLAPIQSVGDLQNKDCSMCLIDCRNSYERCFASALRTQHACLLNAGPFQDRIEQCNANYYSALARCSNSYLGCSWPCCH